AVNAYEPPGKSFTGSVTDPLFRVRKPGFEGMPPVINDTSPVGSPLPPAMGVTAMFKETGLPCVAVIEFGARVVLVALKVIEPHLVTRLFTLTDPSPVARSY